MRLAGPQIRDADLQVLRRLPRLKGVVLHDTLVTDAALAQLQAERPDCLIERLDAFDFPQSAARR